MLGAWGRTPFPIRQWLVDASPGLLGLSLFGKKAPHRDGLGYAFLGPDGRWRLFRFGPKALAGENLPDPLASQAHLLLAHARKASPEYSGFRGAVHAQPFFYDGIFLCHNGTVRDVGRLVEGLGTDSRRVLLWLARHWQPRTPEKLRDSLSELLQLLESYSALNLLIAHGPHLYALCAYTSDSEYFTLWVYEGPEGGAVASEPADREKSWDPLGNHELLMVSPAGVSERLRL
ncbi:MAG: class II glutamine amidotransferase [Candidatus Bipolaricaulaceae bacterium]